MILETAVGSRKSAQALDAPGKFEKALITNKVTTRFSNSPCTSISCTSFSRPTAVSRMIRTIRPLDRPDPGLERVAKVNGFSLHAGVSCEGHQKNKRERLCRCIARPAVAVLRLWVANSQFPH
jgi:hypothetical protein